MGIYEELVWRGLIKDVSSPELKDKLNNGGLTFYIGTDPTGDSLHIGHFSSFLISKRLKDAGHHPILLVGGGTGLIGDPKPTAERPMITYEQVEHNFNCLKKQAEDIFGFEVVNNYDWYKDMNFIDFLRDYGKYFNVSYMLNKDIIKRRLDEGITYAEFSYMILQAMDFYVLHKERGVDMQVAGQDQWGNITAGIELARKKDGSELLGFTMPLLTKSDGTKFGKSEGKAIWLDREKTSPYEMYQFFINSEDEKVIDYLKFLTFLSKEEIEALEESHKKEPHKREAHKALAKEVITFLHGEEAYEEAVAISQMLFSGQIKDLTYDQVKECFNGVPTVEVDEDLMILNALVKVGAASSNREARQFVKGGSVMVNGEKVTDEKFVVAKANAYGEKATVIRRGKKKYFVINHK
ncbi:MULTISPECIES: tyrosine--tRNA ligase [Kandleria]|jgi:tyrosyl-tRNA synthetase|uniref:Tyrosine--tRNA ligase n=2 Tax=Kandleria vitulina TaxID=1630 RepID=A0A0R2HLP7_9FIRM|nr:MULTISPECIES: tyrosine--tRNA ligase [Kandleria]KRN51301.1 tyrosyl-tRNA synthetase [Kandleria vitulina DSM 20405]MBP3277267.1 tyrosine--tRNA ligase [Kandleria sp.]MEE0988877.1 tyrosine--tRNA ligase [Kandleria vitulina]SDL58508.1 tyrosyl-tRNA synthetase [Kandleria vitulina]SDV99517.1 tyrosyl-tRNA synthetase [Kandleria vitulina]